MCGGVIVVIGTAFLVVLFYECNCCIAFQHFTAHYAVYAVLVVGCYENAQHRRVVTQYIFGTASNDNAALVLCDVAYCLALDFEESVMVNAAAVRDILRN